MKIKTNNKVLVIVFAFISFLTIALLILNWQYSITEIDADNYNDKLHPNNKSVWETDIEHYIPKIDAECFSILLKQVFTIGEYNGVKITKTNDLISKKGTNWNSDQGTYYSFESAPSGLEYMALYKPRNDPSKIDMVLEIRIGSNWKYENTLKIKEIIRKLCEQNGFILKRTKLIYGCDVIIKETEDGFIIGRINLKYDNKDQPCHGLYLECYSKKHFF